MKISRALIIAVIIIGVLTARGARGWISKTFMGNMVVRWSLMHMKYFLFIFRRARKMVRGAGFEPAEALATRSLTRVGS